MQLVNSLPQRIYRDGQPIGPGQRYEADEATGDGQYAADSREGKAALAAVETASRGESEGDAAVQKALAAARAAGGVLATSGLRDAIDAEGHAVHGSGVNRLANAPSMPANDPGADQNLGAPEVGELARVSTGVPGSDTIAQPREDGDTPLDAIEGAADAVREGTDAAANSPSYADGVKFTSAAAENAADAKVASGDLDPADLEPGGGSGADGAYKTDDF